MASIWITKFGSSCRVIARSKRRFYNKTTLFIYFDFRQNPSSIHIMQLISCVMLFCSPNKVYDTLLTITLKQNFKGKGQHFINQELTCLFFRTSYMQNYNKTSWFSCHTSSKNVSMFCSLLPYRKDTREALRVFESPTAKDWSISD